jgi:hypothetical protein
MQQPAPIGIVLKHRQDARGLHVSGSHGILLNQPQATAFGRGIVAGVVGMAAAVIVFAGELWIRLPNASTVNR